jgi:hypothetical protein
LQSFALLLFHIRVLATMIFSRDSLIVLLAAALASSSGNYANAFSPVHRSSHHLVVVRPVATPVVTAMSTMQDDCGCQDTLYSGKPSEIARQLNPREVIRKPSFLSVDGDKIYMDDLIGQPSEEQISVVVLLRSLG